MSELKPKSILFADIFHNRFTAWVVLGISLAITLLGWIITTQYVNKQVESRFLFEVKTATDAIEKRMQEYEQVLRGGVGLMKSSKVVDRQEWQVYVSNLLIETYWPGIQGIGYAEMVKPQDKSAHEERIRKEGFPNYVISPGGERDIYSAIIYLEPFSARNIRAFGYDMYSNPVRREAMLRAAKTGGPALSGRVTLVQETDVDVQAGFLVYLPFYEKGMPVVTEDDRLQAIKGFVYSPFRAKDLFHGILGDDDPVIDYQIYDGDFSVDNALLYDTLKEFKVNKADIDSNLRETVELELLGRKWHIDYQGRADLKETIVGVEPNLIVVVGLIIDAILFWVIFSLAKQRDALTIQSDEFSQLMEQFKDSESRLKLTHEVAKLGSWNRDLRSNTLSWSDQTYRIFGLAPGAPIDNELLTGFYYKNDINKVRSAWKEAITGKPFDIEHRIWSNGVLRWVNQRAEVIFDEMRRHIFAQGSIQDITDRKETELALRLGTRVIQSARESILITDANANLIDVNPMFSELTGYSRAEVVGKNPRFLGSGRHDGAFFEEMWNELGASGTWQGEIWNKTKHGDVFACRINISTLKDELTGETLNYVGMFSDVTEIRQQQERMEHLAHHDPLTDLPNRLEFMDRLSQEVSRTVRYDRMMAVAYIDLDGFKPVNDDYGHLVGDLALKEVAERLRFAVRKEDLVARLGGDDFAVIFF